MDLSDFYEMMWGGQEIRGLKISKELKQLPLELMRDELVKRDK